MGKAEKVNDAEVLRMVEALLRAAYYSGPIEEFFGCLEIHIADGRVQEIKPRYSMRQKKGKKNAA